MYAPSIAQAAQPPSMASSSARPLQLDQWANTKAPLTSSQRASVNRLAEWLHRNSSDFKPQNDQQRQVPPSQPGNGSSGPPAAADPTDIDDTAPISTLDLTSTKGSEAVSLPEAGVPLASAQSFLAWYTQLSDSITSSTQTSHRQALQRISDTTSTADNLLAQLEACQVNVSELRAGTAFVQDSSRGIREQAQSLLDSQTHLDTLAEEIASRLSFFTLLPYATNMLSSPDSTIVYSQSFLDLMDQLEMALLFLQQEPAASYHDAALYRMRYAQCVTRAATLAKLAVVREFRAESECTADKLKQLDSSRNSDGTSAATAAEAGLDAKGKGREVTHDSAIGLSESAIPTETAEALFGGAEHQVAKLRPLIFELQRRASNAASSSSANASTSAEYESLLQECRAAWFQYRRPLLSRTLAQGVTEIEAQPTSSQAGGETSHPVVQFARSGTHLVRFVLQREHDLYQQFFGGDPSLPASTPEQESDPALAAYLSEIAETFTARLRPRLFKEENLVVLSQTSAVVSDTVLADERKTPWVRSLQPVVNEAQSRLIARAQVVISSDIASFTAREERGDLEFPERIRTYKASLASLGTETVTTTSTATVVKGSHRRGKSGAGLLDAALPTSHAASTSKTQQEKVELFTLPAALLSTYYAPIEYMLELLFNLQARVPASAFRRIAIAAVEACLASVSTGSQALVKRTKGDSLEREDGWLFEIRQLEILRETVVSADLVLKQAYEQQNAGGDVAADGKGRARSDSQLNAGTTAALVDLSSLIAAINSLWTNTGRLFYPTTNVDAAEADSLTSTQLDMEPCTSNVAFKLQTLVEQVSKLWADSIILPLRVYIDQSAAEANAAKFTSTYQAFETCIESITPEKAGKVTLWVEDREVQRLIVAGVVAKVTQAYATFIEMKPADAGEVNAVDRTTERVRGEWGKVLSL
ncbi:Conserved oligomeric Golgi complex, subunit 3 [Kalmanozyma brasiliensis GHG001]|uniref:Conserved oligomeric Golgi complex subunit 3 n=1 Tax=Kalmanozyma brasiliensis (strain GHG001) TaxID=1365824 RepID=V5GMM6_KALBG|nr:Conserved oligomeric Golgi complex, subunit 3 [Kalmanozyma brasiliensis GHG001]EST07217.1 Conserved oligomeric Golgi complex, subunit 3 [Kalmanozyma brasiliensis GHG001]